MNIIELKRRCLPMGATAYFGGDSSAATTNSTEVRDMRVVGGNDSQNISANNSSITVVASDSGAINAGSSIAAAGLGTANNAFALSTQLVGDNTKNVLSTGLSMFDGAIKAIKDSNTSALGLVKDSNSAALNAVSSARGDVASAWQDSQTPENSMLKIAGFVVVGIAAIGLFTAKMK